MRASWPVIVGLAIALLLAACEQDTEADGIGVELVARAGCDSRA